MKVDKVRVVEIMAKIRRKGLNNKGIAEEVGVTEEELRKFLTFRSEIPEDKISKLEELLS